MGYKGGKFKLRHQISTYVNSLSPRRYLEPFCGYCWVGERVRCQQRIFSDANEDLILMWQALQTGWHPPTVISEEEYKVLRQSPEHSALRGFAGTACAIFNDWFAGYARDPKAPKNFAALGARQLLRRIHSLRSATFYHGDYRQAMDRESADVIYLDPPYAGTDPYHAFAEEFDSKTFWNEVRKRSDGSRRILVSEYKCPDDFTVVMRAKSRMGLRVKTENGLRQELRDEIVVEYEPPKRRRMVSFGSLLEV